MVKVFHNPRCSKSREVLRRLRDRGVDPEVVEYLRYPLSVDQLRDLLSLLGLSPRDIVRRGERVFKDLLFVNPSPSDDDLLNWLSSNPVLIERPIIVGDDGRAVVGRPPERVDELF